MSNIAILGHPTRGREVIQLLEMLGGIDYFNLTGAETDGFYYIYHGNNKIYHCLDINTENVIIYNLEEFEENFPYKVGDKVYNIIHNEKQTITEVAWDFQEDEIIYQTNNNDYLFVHYLQPYEEENYCQVIGNDTSSNGVDTSASSINEETTEEDKGNISDGYHTFNELYEYRLLYNASLFNELAKQGLYDVHKSRLHSNGEIPFGDSNWFIVMAELPTGQISNHYEMKDWDLFQIPEKAKANVWDGHSPQDVANRLREFLTPKSIYPKDYEECYEVLGISDNRGFGFINLRECENTLMSHFIQLKRCHDAYWKIAGEQMGLGEPWKPDWKDEYERYYTISYDGVNIKCYNCTDVYSKLAFPTAEMRDAFYENFKELIEQCKELL